MASSPPPHWQVLSRARWWQPLTLLFGAAMLLFLAVVVLGGLGALGLQLWRGTLLERDRSTLLGAALTGVVGPFLGWAFLRHGFGSLFDAMGAERTLEGVVERLEAKRGTRGVSYSMVVAGRPVALSHAQFSQLREGGHVWVRAGRFERDVKVLAVPETHGGRRRYRRTSQDRRSRASFRSASKLIGLFRRAD